MLRKILATVGTRYVIAALNLVLMLINSRVLGRHDMGVAGVVFASANVAVMFASVLCGNTIVYFMPSKRLSVVVSAAYVWALVGSDPGLQCRVSRSRCGTVFRVTRTLLRGRAEKSGGIYARAFPDKLGCVGSESCAPITRCDAAEGRTIRQGVAARHGRDVSLRPVE